MYYSMGESNGNGMPLSLHQVNKSAKPIEVNFVLFNYRTNGGGVLSHFASAKMSEVC